MLSLFGPLGPLLDQSLPVMSGKAKQKLTFNGDDKKKFFSLDHLACHELKFFFSLDDHALHELVGHHEGSVLHHNLQKRANLIFVFSF